MHVAQSSEFHSTQITHGMRWVGSETVRDGVANVGFLLFFSPYSDSGCARTIVHEHVDRIRSPHALDHDAVCDRPQWQ